MPKINIQDHSFTNVYLGSKADLNGSLLSPVLHPSLLVGNLITPVCLVVFLVILIRDLL